MTTHLSRSMLQNAGTRDADAFVSIGPVLDLRALLGILGRQKLWLLLPPVLALVLVLAVAPLIPERYQASTQLLIDPRGLQVVDKELTPSAQTSDASMTIVESQVRVITSERVLRDLIARERLTTDPEFARTGGPLAPLRAAVRRLIGGAEVPEEPTLRVLRLLQKRVSVKRNERSYIIDIAVEASSPQMAARLADALATAYLEGEFSARSDLARRVGVSLSARLSELRDEVRTAEERVEAFKAESNIVGAAGRLVSEQQLSDLNGQLVVARARTAELKVRTEQIEQARRSGDASSITEAVQSQTIAQMRSQLLDIKRRQSDAMTLLGARHPEVVTLEAQARTARGQIREELDRIANAARIDYERARANEASLSRSLDGLKNDALSTNRAFVRLRELERAVESSRSVYESFLRRAKEVSEQQAVDSANSRVISRAVPPRDSTNMPLVVLLLAALVAGGGIGVCAAWLRDALRRPGLPVPPRDVYRHRAA
ncbi:GumC family protein [Methylobacterium sp. ID0610]|uniref:GumC family protein n=1 Tax=Methylobacterium carpenticola TaxID=3344827 RepID=UPI003696B148